MLIVGLGNPGEKYARTRHNLGARVVEACAPLLTRSQRDRQSPQGDLSGTGWIQLKKPAVRIYRVNENVTCLIPMTGMNDSGTPVAEWLHQSPLEPSQVLLVHDDLELPLGEIKFQAGGSARGHKGVRSVHEKLGTTEIPRLRLGLGRPPAGADASNYVLENFTGEEEAIVKQMVERAEGWLRGYLPHR